MFQIGDKVVYPMHGAGIIISIDERELDGEQQPYYIINMPICGMKLMLPVNSNCGEKILRAIITKDTARSIIDDFSTLEYDMNANWNKRYRENLVRLKSGDINDVSQVYKCLLVHDFKHGLSIGERKMLQSARNILLSELVLSLDIDIKELETHFVNLVKIS